MAIQRGDRRRRLPHGEMKYVFRICHATIPHFQVVKIVPGTWLSFADNRSVFVDNVHHGAVKAGERAVVGGAYGGLRVSITNLSCVCGGCNMVWEPNVSSASRSRLKTQATSRRWKKRLRDIRTWASVVWSIERVVNVAAHPPAV